jgi:hypothetical protein
MGELLQAAMPQLHGFSPQDLANMAWALATLGHAHAHSGFMCALLQAALPQLHSFSPQDLAKTIRALATLGHVDAVFMDALLQAAAPQLRSFTPQELANTAWALASLGHEDAVFMGALLQAATPRLGRFDQQDLANTAWALATLGHADAVFMGALAQAATPQLRSFSPQDLAKTAWAVAAIDEQNAAFVGALVFRAAAAAERFNPSQLCELLPFVLWLSSSSDKWYGGAGVPPQLDAACKEAWRDQACKPPASLTRLQVLDAIRQLPGCFGASSGHLTDDALFTIDIAVLLPGHQLLAVEVDGPTHCLVNAPTVPSGATRLRKRLLEARGWRVASVPVAEWDRQAAKGKKAVHDYLTSLCGVCG